MNQEQYIEHEVKLRVQDERFKAIEKAVSDINAKFNFVAAFVIGSILVPIILHHYGLI